MRDVRAQARERGTRAGERPVQTVGAHAQPAADPELCAEGVEGGSVALGIGDGRDVVEEHQLPC